MKHFISQYWKIIVGIISIFIGGLGFGAVLESLRHRDDPPPSSDTRSDKDWIESTLASLDRSLALTDEQKNLIRPEVETAALEIHLSREGALLNFELSLLELHQSIATKLDEEQRQKLQESQRILENRIQQRNSRLQEIEPPPVKK